jgi:serine phosphatase RsbU (regulator of sigma subunit)
VIVSCFLFGGYPGGSDPYLVGVEGKPIARARRRAMGVVPDVDIDHAGVSCELGDRLVLCTDGLFKALSPDEIKFVLASEVEPSNRSINWSPMHWSTNQKTMSPP